MRLTPDRRLALLMHGQVRGYQGKMGLGLLRYSECPVAAVIDREAAGGNLAALTGVSRHAPIVATVAEAAALGADTLIPAIAPPNGILPPEWRAEILNGLRLGMSLVNGLHERMGDAPDLRAALSPSAWVWDIRQEPPGLQNGTGAARTLPGKRVLTIGTDMAIGKMTASLELHRAALARGISSAFVATGQIGIAISGSGVPLDAVRVDFATGAVECAVLDAAQSSADILWIEGQGSILHPASSAWLSLIRGAVPTHLILCHRAGQTSVMRAPWVRIPPLSDVIALYEAVCAPILPAKVVGVALNTATLTDDEAHAEIERTGRETGLPCADVVRFGAEKLWEAVCRG